MKIYVSLLLTMCSSLFAMGPQQCDPRLFAAVKSGNSEDLSTLVLSCQDSINTADEYGDTPLHVAAKSGHLKVVEILLKNGGDGSCESFNVIGDTPLHCAVRCGYKEIVDVLLCEQRYLDLENEVGDTPLCLAVQCGHFEIAKSLLEKGACVHGSSCKKIANSPLHYANNEAIVQLLVTSGANVNQVGVDRRTPLYSTEALGYVKGVKELLKYEGVVVDATDVGGQTALHYAALGGHLEVVRVLLLDPRVNINAKSDYSVFSTSLWKAVDKEHLSIIRQLVAHDAELPTYYDVDNKIALDEYCGNVAEVKHCNTLRLLLALTTGRIAEMCDIVSSGIPININAARRPNFNTALHIAVINNRTQIARYLINHGADLNAINIAGNTPLHVALTSSHKNLRMIGLLLAAGKEKNDGTGANIFLENHCGIAPMDLMTKTTGVMGLLLLATCEGVVKKDVTKQNRAEFLTALIDLGHNEMYQALVDAFPEATAKRARGPERQSQQNQEYKVSLAKKRRLG